MSEGVSMAGKPSPWPLHREHTGETRTISSTVSPPSSYLTQILAALGLQSPRSFHRDPAFLLLVALGPMVWLAMTGFSALHPLPWQALRSPAFLSAALWQPLFEELLFRGIVQGYALQSRGMQKAWNGITLANLLTSLLFSLVHLASHSIGWAFLIFVPALCFGFVRDRFGSVYPAIALHVFYNAGYFSLVGGTSLLNSR